MTDEHALVRKLRTELLVNQPFFGHIATLMELVEDPHMETAAVDDRALYYNLDFVKTLSHSQQLTLIAHETLHIALGHLWRIWGRHAVLWNIAADFAINLILKDSGFSPIPRWLYDTRYEKLSAEEIYAKLLADKPNMSPDQVAWECLTEGSMSGGKESKKGKFPPSMKGVPTGDMKAPGSGENKDKDKKKKSKGKNNNQSAFDHSEESWKSIVEQAAQAAELAGTLPGGLKTLLRATHEPTVDWRQELREFVEKAWGHELSWTHPNRRYISQNMYVPGYSPEDKMGELVVFVDCSGSTQALRNIFASELTGVIREVRPEKVVVVYWDTRVTNTQEFTPDEPLELDSGKSDGGTVITPALQWVEDNNLNPVAAICLTDLEIVELDVARDRGDTMGGVPETPYPMLWAVPEFCKIKPPFGIVLKVKDPHKSSE